MPGFRAELTECFSTPCDDNPTMIMLEAGYRHLGLDWRYINAKVGPAGLAGRGTKKQETAFSAS